MCSGYSGQVLLRMMSTKSSRANELSCVREDVGVDGSERGLGTVSDAVSEGAQDAALEVAGEGARR